MTTMSLVNSSNVDEIYKTTYIQCILNATNDLSCIVTLITTDLQSINDAVNNIKTTKDAKITTESILSVFNTIEEKIKKAKTNLLIDSLKVIEISTKNQIPTIHVDEDNDDNIINVEGQRISNIDEIEISSSSDIEIVNEIKYLNSNSVNVFNEDEYINQVKDKNRDIEVFSAEEQPAIDSDSVKDKNLLIKSIAGKQNQYFNDFNDIVSLNNNENLESQKLISSDTVKTASSSNLLKFNSHYLSDEKLQVKCIVLLNRTVDELTNKKTKKSVHEEKTLEDKKFSKLINLNIFKKKNYKRNELLSDCSSVDYNKNIEKSKKYSKIKRKQCKKLKLTLSNDGFTSNDDTSSSASYSEDSRDLLSSDIESDYDIYNTNNIQCNTEEQIEERLKQKLIASDDSSEMFDTDEDEHSVKETCKKQRKRNLESSSDSSSTTKTGQRYKKSKWLNDKLLNFKLSESSRHEDKIMKTNETDTKEMSDLCLNKNYLKLNGNKKNVSFTSKGCDSIDNKDSSFSDPNLSSSSEMETENSQKSINDGKVIDVNVNTVAINDSFMSHAKYKQVGRRNIRKLFDDEEITENTKQAVKDEETRLQRLAKRKEQLLLLQGTKEKDRLILDFDIENNKELVTVDKELCKFLKPHQEDGIRFMWDSCFESVKLSRSTEGSGCILAHCMGLGKTFQIVTLSHTLLTNKTVGVQTIMVVCPMNTVHNWLDEFNLWLKNVKIKIHVYNIIGINKTSSRLNKLETWHKEGGVLIISYDMLRSVVSRKRKSIPWQIQQIRSCLLNPGADLVVCDEGHLLKNEESLLANTMQRVKTKRRIILTGTPLQNNLSEYHCMVQFVKRNLLGTKIEFQNRFGNPITNGQFDNSTPEDVKLMKQRAFVLHRMLQGCVQRCDYAVLTPFLPPKQEYVILIHLSDLQKEMYKYYITNVAKIDDKHCSLFKNYNEIKRLVAHPMAMQLKIKEKKNVNDNNMSQFNNISTDFWWAHFLKDIHLEDINLSNKLIILFGILERCQQEENKILVFSQCLHTLDVIETFLKNLDCDRNLDDSLFNYQSKWKCGLDYFRLDGSCTSSKRHSLCKTFNDQSNKRARLFLISTKAGGLGINLTGANRVVIFDPSWNPSNDLQSIFRVFRFGQQKPCYIYRFLTAGTMEQKIYNRQVTKLSLSLRVLDEQQIKRHYRDNELAELYQFEPLVDDTSINLPKDRLLVDLVLKYKEYIYNIFEHESLLENKEEEELDEDERKQAWFEYQQEKLQKNDVGNKFKGKLNLKKRSKIENNLDCQEVDNTVLQNLQKD